MKKIRFIFMMACLLFTLGFGTTAPGMKAEAAKLTNVMKAPKAKAGKWVISARGYRYRYKNGKYAKSSWLNIKGEIYYFMSNGYLKTGIGRYNGKRYFFRNDGTLATGWQKVDNKKYYFSPKTGAAATGKVKIASKYYYFSSVGVMQTGWKKIGKYYYYFQSNGTMAVNKTIGKYYVNANGVRTTAVAGATNNKTQANAGKGTTAKTGKVDIFVGDSRTVGLGSAVGISSKCIAKVGEGYDWFLSTGEAALKKKLKANPTATVVFNLGINDVANYNLYITRYKKLMQSYPKAKFYFMSINPIDKKYDWGWFTCSELQSWIKKFNTALKKAFPNQYIDCNTYLTKNKFATVDGLHYTAATYKKIYNYILTQV